MKHKHKTVEQSWAIRIGRVPETGLPYFMLNPNNPGRGPWLFDIRKEAMEEAAKLDPRTRRVSAVVRATITEH